LLVIPGGGKRAGSVNRVESLFEGASEPMIRLVADNLRQFTLKDRNGEEDLEQSKIWKGRGTKVFGLAMGALPREESGRGFLYKSRCDQTAVMRFAINDILRDGKQQEIEAPREASRNCLVAMVISTQRIAQPDRVCA